jgi:flagellar biosynthesis protein FlhG
MKSLDSQNHYEVLEVSPGARQEEIERAYRLATSTWAEGSLALYSVFDESDSELMRSRIDQAYRVLSDDHSRHAYDRATFDEIPVPSRRAGPAGDPLPEVAPDYADYDDMEISLESALDGKVDGSHESGESDWDGARLRRARMHRGVELEEIGQITKVTLTYLQAIEDDAFDSLPASVYARGFVSAYARAIGLDPNRVAKSYMPRLEAARKEKGRGRLLGRK